MTVQKGCTGVSKAGIKHHLHRKAQVLPYEPGNAYALPVSQSDLQCFSHEDGCLTAGNELYEQPSHTVTDESHRKALI